MSRKMEKNTKDRKKKTMYYNDHLEAAEKDMSSRNFCTLVDAAAMLYDKEEDRTLKSNCNTKTDTLSENEEDMDKRIYHLFPRKPRSSLKKSSPPQNHENLDGASTSSSLLDLNKVPDDSETEAPSNPRQCLSLSSSPSFLAAHSALNHTQSHPSSSTLLVDYNTEEEVEETEMKTNAPNPDSQSFPSSSKTEKRSRKKRAMQERKRTTGGKSNKATVPPYSWIGRATPEWLVNLMETMAEENIVTEGPWLIFEKKLTVTDVNPSQSRLLMPFKKLIRNDFLNPAELKKVAVEDEEEEDEKNGVGVILVDQRSKKWDLILKSREMMKDSGNGTLNYALIRGWNNVVEDNGLKAGDDISVWYFRWRKRLYFALVLPPPNMA